MKNNISITQLVTIHQILREAEDKILNSTGHKLNLYIEETEMTFGIGAIASIVSESLGVPLYVVLSESREGQVKIARQICIWLIKKYLPEINNADIARHINRDRATVLHSLRYVNDRIATDDEVYLNKLNIAETALKTAVNEAKVNT
jgi:chromosomal replication initiation ATPase DnaA